MHVQQNIKKNVMRKFAEQKKNAFQYFLFNEIHLGQVKLKKK